MVLAHTYDPSTQEAEASQVSRENSRTAGATTQRKPVISTLAKLFVALKERIFGDVCCPVDGMALWYGKMVSLS